MLSPSPVMCPAASEGNTAAGHSDPPVSGCEPQASEYAARMDGPLNHNAGVVEALLVLRPRFQSGDFMSFALQLAHRGGTNSEAALNFETEQQTDLALATLRRLLGQLH